MRHIIIYIIGIISALTSFVPAKGAYSPSLGERTLSPTGERWRQPERGREGCGGGSFVTVRSGQFYLGDAPYTYIGTNFWYGPILASEGQGGDRQRLSRELDAMQKVGIRNLRVLVGAEGSTERLTHIRPILQPEPGVYNDTLLRGLDYFLAELERRQMTAVLYLTNSWEWSGGYGAYLEWAGEGQAPEPSDWQGFVDFHSHFVQNARAKALVADHVKRIVSRTNTVTGRPYAESPAIMAWELANEPRAFSRQPAVKEAFLDWARNLAALIKSLDPNHLVTTGSEGLYGCEVDMDLFRRLHTLPEIDYACIHIWPHTWGWMGAFKSPTAEARRANGIDGTEKGFQSACDESQKYIDGACKALEGSGRPIVIEEFGYPRDGYAITRQSTTQWRDAYYAFIFQQMQSHPQIAACNFWGWGGLARPPHDTWQPGDPYTCDPNHEEQGLYSVFSSDKGTLRAVKTAAKALRRTKDKK